MTTEPTARAVSATTEPEAPNACLMCAATGLAIRDGERTVPAHTPVGTAVSNPNGDPAAVTDAEPGPCLGSGFVRRLYDGRDDVRRYAIRRFRGEKGDETALLTKLRQHLDRGVGFETVVQQVGAHLVAAQLHARLFALLALHGRWEEGIRECGKYIIASGNSTNLPARMAAEWQREAARMWWDEAVMQLSAGFGDTVPTETVQAMLGAWEPPAA
jgi:hypothetical protein